MFNQNQPFWWDAARIVEDDFTFPLHEEAPHSRKTRRGKQGRVISDDKHGYYVRFRHVETKSEDIAVDATLRAAALYQAVRRKADPDDRRAFIVHKQDLMEKVRVRKVSNLIVFLLDLSWSMAVTQRMKATKHAILSILTNAYQKRDSVCLVTFQKEEAKLVIPPTRSVVLAERAMKKMSVGGKTPLAAGLVKVYEVMSVARQRDPGLNIQMIALTDGDGNVSLNGGDPKEESRKAAEKIAEKHFSCVVVNTEQITFDQGYANLLAKQLNAPCHLIANVRSEHLLWALNRS